MLNFIFIYVMYIQHTSLGNYLGTSLSIENFMRIRVTSVEWTWSGLERPLV